MRGLRAPGVKGGVTAGTDPLHDRVCLSVPDFPATRPGNVANPAAWQQGCATARPCGAGRPVLAEGTDSRRGQSRTLRGRFELRPRTDAFWYFNNGRVLF